jgi:8-oxo-dGTP diphosphatase
MIEVVCALIIKDGKLLIVQHGANSHHPWKWEFPGGKIHPGETHSEALIREIQEELDIIIEVRESLIPVTHHYSTHTILLVPFVCQWISGSMHLKEHHAMKWVVPAEAFNFDLLEADRAMINAGENFVRLMNEVGK